MGIPEQSDRRKEAFNIVLSMPPGTDRQAVHEAVRAFAQAQFQDYQYVFAAHNDEKHPHVHLCVKATSYQGVRLNPRKNDLQSWREHFAEKLHDYGIEANATPRRARGVVQKAERQVLRHIDEEMQRGWRTKPCWVRQAQHKAACHDVQTNEHPINQAQTNIVTRRHTLQKAYAHVAKALVNGDEQDRKLAVNIVHFIHAMPLPLTRHKSLVQELYADKHYRQDRHLYIREQEQVHEKHHNVEHRY